MDTKVGLDIKYRNTLDYAQYLDEIDPLKSFRDKFYIPMVNGKESIYFTGNSLGLQPKTTQEYVLNELEDWANYGVEGHLHSRNPWLSYHEMFPGILSEIVGGLPEEIVVMNQLTVNLHLLMTSFYRPTKKRFKIICEAKAFPSDQYAIRSQVELHGLDPDKTIIEIEPRPGEHSLRTKDILKYIKKHGKKTSLMLFFILQAAGLLWQLSTPPRGLAKFFKKQIFSRRTHHSSRVRSSIKCQPSSQIMTTAGSKDIRSRCRPASR